MDFSAVVVAIIVFLGAYFRWWTDKQHDRRTINKAILAEVQRLLNVLRSTTKWWGDCVETGTTDHILLPFSTDIYDVHVKDIGVIDTEIVADIVTFYGYVNFINRYLETEKIVQEKEGGKAEFDKSYLKLLEKTLAKYDSKFTSAFSQYGIT